MLQIDVPISPEGWDETKQEFVEPKVQTLCLEHSLVSISKWESRWHRSFFSKKERTPEETIHYIQCMTLTKNVSADVYSHLTRSNIEQINQYIENPMSATHFFEDKNNKSNRETITSELIYCWMIALNIPFECQKWHLNRLLTLIRVCNIKNQPPQKRNTQSTISQYAALNAARRQQFNSKG